MALANKCDRCGALYEHYLIGCQAGIYNGIACVRTDESGHVCAQSRRMDLCPSCMDLISRYLRLSIHDARYRKTGRIGKTDPTMRQYVASKIYMLRWEFFIRLTHEDIIYLHTLPTKNDVDRAAHKIIVERL